MASTTDLEQQFDELTEQMYWEVGRATRGAGKRGYWPTYWLRAVRNRGGVEAARRALRSRGVSNGFKRLAELGRLDLSLEAIVLREPWSTLFTETELARARARLRDQGYHGA